MKIGDLATLTACAVETIRYYEREGLLPEPGRSLGNYRIYGEPHVERLMFIRNCRAFDMTHEEIRALLGFRDRGDKDCGDIDALLDEHIRHVESRIAELQALKLQLGTLRESCGRGVPVEKCGVVRGLSKARKDPGKKTLRASHLRSAHTGKS
jgi:Cd(II)/Pb(II)-responsive transcriptional regulator